VAVLGSTVGVSFGFLSPLSLVLDWSRIVQQFEIWRLVTNLVFYGKFSFNFVISLYLLVQYSTRYEVSPYNTGAGGTSADYAWMLCLGAMLLSGLGWIFDMALMGEGLSFMILYVN
jgi:Derlin-2/3